MRRTLISLSLLLLAGGASAEVLPFSVEVGYRWTNIRGNQGVYDTQINEQQGLILRAFSLAAPGWRIEGSDLGATPAGSLRIEAGREGMYRLRIGYRQMDAFSDLPGFANPLLAQGVLYGQHTLDRTRSMVDADLEFLPGRRFTPFVGYSWNRNDGPGQTTYFAGQDEFLLLQDLRETDREFRAGTSFQFSRVYGSVAQGWRSFRGTEVLSLAPDAGNGNNDDPILGNPIDADTITRSNRIEVNTPFTNAFLTVRPISRLKVIGSYARFSAKSDGLGDESLTGSFISFPLSREFAGLTENANGRLKNTTWRGTGRAEVEIVDGIDLLANYGREHRELDGASLINTLYMQSLTFGGLDPRDVQAVLDSSSGLSRDEDVWSAGATARALGPLTLRAEYRQTSGEYDIAQDLSEIVVPGNQDGFFKRRIRTLDAGGSFARAGFSLIASWKRDRANTAVFRTDFLDRDRYRARAGWASPKKTFAVGLSAEQIDQDNQSEIGFEGKFRQYTGELELTPLKQLRLRGAATRFRSDTDVLVRKPETFETTPSIHKENGRSYEGEFDLLFSKLTLDGGYARFTNEGSIPFEIDRYRARAVLNLKAKAGLAAEWNRDKYSESDLPMAGFEADRFGLFVTWRP
jgi:hypothetical protein